MRKEGWEEVLMVEITAAAGRRFERGVFDCCMWPADIVLLITGIDGAASFRGAYHDRRSAFAALKKFSGGGVVETMRKLATQHDWEQIPPKLAQRGDVCVVNNDEGHSLAICAGVFCVTPSLNGGLAKFGVDEALYAWRIN